MHKFVFVVLCALLVGGALGEAALGNYYKDVVREQHKLINEMNQNFTELEKASEKLIDLGFYVGKHKLPPKTVKITNTVAVKVPVPFPVKVPEPVPVPVPVSKPVPVPVPTLVAIPVESTVATVPAVTVAGSTSAGGPSPSPATVADADPASSQAHASTVQVQEYVQSFPIHSVYDAGDDYNPMEGNRLALAEHTASPTESTFSKPSPSSLQQLEEYHHQHHQRHHAQQHSPQSKHHQHQSPAQTGSHSSAEQYYGGHGASAQRQYYVGGAQVQAGAHSAAKFRPESHALQSASESYDFGDAANQFHTASFTSATDSTYSAASGLAGGKSAPSASSAIGEDYRFASEQQQQQQFQRGQHGESHFETEQFGRGGTGGDARGAGRGGAGESSGGRIVGGEIGGIGGGDTETGAHSYVRFSEAADYAQADHQAAEVSRFQSEGETRLQAGFEAGFQEGLQATHQAGLEAGLQAGLEAGLQAEQAAEKGAHRHGTGTKGKEVSDLTPRPFQTVRESYPRYEKPDFDRYRAESGDHHHHHHHPSHDHHAADHPQQSVVRGGSSTGSVLTEGYDHPAFAKSHRPAAAAAASSAGILPTTATTHGYSVSGERSVYPSVSTAGYHHSHPYPANVPGEAHKDLRHQADATGEQRFPFYHATKHDPHLARSALKPHHADAAAGGPSYQLQQQYGEHAESQTGGSAAQTGLSGFRHNAAGGYNTYTEHHNYHHHHHYLNGQQHDRQKHKGSYGARTVKPTVLSVPSDAHLYPGYNQHHDHHHHGSDATAADNHAGKFHYHFHNVHPVGGGAGSGPDHHESAASEQYAVHTEYGGVAGPDGSVVTSYDPPASGNTFHFHDDGTGDMFAGASTVQEQHRAPYEEESSSYGHTQ
ncbi:filaggrin-2-like isoform X1 [Anopheles stephensi]|uniref:filaggrin-2-like isoform X1 n=1 Tax=Anopheles stephensi TaxID=30069 RepID=UPI0016588173|nr:filaggrin-2-like isoform X1 [Anopheles stephensi]